MGNFNRAAFDLIYGWSHRNAFLDAVGVFCANYIPYFLVLGVLVLIYYEKDRRRRILLAAESALAVILSRGIVTEVIRFFYHHPRPMDALGVPALLHESGSSFPSGHATAFFALAMIVWFWNKRWGEWYFILSVFVVVARVYAGVHWPLDIIAGAVIGIVSGLIVERGLKPQREALRPHP